MVFTENLKSHFREVATILFRKIESLIGTHLRSDSKRILLIDGVRQVGKTFFKYLCSDCIVRPDISPVLLAR